MKVRPALTLLFVLVLGVAAGGRAAAAVPPAPTPLAPAFGANVLVPFTISWSAVSDPSGIVAYNWQEIDDPAGVADRRPRSEEHTSELQSRLHLVCRLLLEKKKRQDTTCRR